MFPKDHEAGILPASGKGHGPFGNLQFILSRFQLIRKHLLEKIRPAGGRALFLFLYVPSSFQVGDYVLVHLLVYLILRAVDEIARDYHYERDDEHGDLEGHLAGGVDGLRRRVAGFDAAEDQRDADYARGERTACLLYTSRGV